MTVLTSFITFKYAGWILDDQLSMLWHKYNGNRITVLLKIRSPFIFFINCHHTYYFSLCKKNNIYSAVNTEALNKNLIYILKG